MSIYNYNFYVDPGEFSFHRDNLSLTLNILDQNLILWMQPFADSVAEKATLNRSWFILNIINLNDQDVNTSRL